MIPKVSPTTAQKQHVLENINPLAPTLINWN